VIAGAPAPVAAVVYGPNDDVDTPMAACVAALEAQGVRVGGLLQRFGARIGPGKREMLLSVLPGRRTIRLNDPRGPGVLGCTLDADALASAAMALREMVRDRPEFVAISRFGKEEAAGGGIRNELADIVLDGIPLLIGVRRSLLPAWEAFVGGSGIRLAPQASALIDWARSVSRQAALAER
jgi:hypothetical protein